jgi:hypothetical protein
MTDVDQILRTHAAEAARAELDPAAWDRLVGRLEEEPPLVVPIDGRPAGPRRARRRLLAAAIVVVMAGIAAGAVVASRPTGDAEDMIRPADTAPPAPPTTEAGSGRPDVDPGTMPDSIVAVVDHDGDGLPDLVRLEGIGISEDVPGPNGTTARGIRPPEVTVLVPGSDVTPATITSVDVAADGTAFYAVGEEVWTVDGSNGLVSGPVAQGTRPAVSEDGETIATVVGVDIRVLDVPRGESTVLDHHKVFGEEVTALSISPDGGLVARQRVTRAAEGTVADVAVAVTAVDDPTGWEEIERSSGAGLPAFMADGHLALGLGAFGASEGHTQVRASEVGMADLATGEVRWSVGGGGFSFTTFDASPDGRWVFAAQDGVIRAFAAVDGWLWDSGTVVQLDGIDDAAW